MTDHEDEPELERAGAGEGSHGEAECRIHMPALCAAHAGELFRAIGMVAPHPDLPALAFPAWESGRQVAALLCNALVMSELTRTDRIRRRCDSDPANLSLVLAELGCLACDAPATFARARRFLEARGPLESAALLRDADAGDQGWAIPDVEARSWE